MSRKLISFASAGATMLLLAACGGGTSASPTSTPQIAATLAPVPTVEISTPVPEMAVTSAMTATEMMTGTTTPDATGAMTPTEMMTGTTMPDATSMMTPTEMMTATEAMSGTSMMDMDIAEVAMGNSQFTTLVAALQAAGLTETLKGEGPFTVFAPTNEAFAKLDAATLADLLKPENKDALAKILTYHVVSGKVLAADVMKMTAAKTVEGSDLTITVDGSTVMVNDAKVIMTDIQTKNGVIHAIDTVLMPKTN